MAVEIITKTDLEQFGTELLEKLKVLLKSNEPTKEPEVVWLKSHQVQRMLGISTGTLQTFRINGTIPYTKIGGVIYYDKRDIVKVFEMNKRNNM